MSHPHNILEHRKSAKEEGQSLLRSVVLTNLGMMVFESILFPPFWFGLPPFQEPQRIFVVVFLLIQAAIASILVFVALRHLKSNEEFVCRMDCVQLVCILPSVDTPAFLRSGESFCILLSDISKLEEVKDSDTVNHSTWYIWSRSGEKYWLTSNYDNPVEDFVEAIRKRIPDVAITKSRFVRVPSQNRLT